MDPATSQRGSPAQRDGRGAYMEATRGSPKPKRIERGIFECHRADGSRYLRLDFRDQTGRRVREHAGETIRDARALRSLREHEVRTRSYEHPDDRKQREETERLLAAASLGPTFDEFADTFLLEYVKPRCRSTYYETSLRKIRPFFVGRRLREITPADLDAYRTHCFNEDRVGHSTTRKRLIVLGTVFRQATRWRVVDLNPATDLEKPGEPEHKTRYLSREEFERLAAHSEPWLRPILTAAVLTGARMKEVLGLRWENVDRDAGVLFISEDNKTGKPRGIPFGATLRKLLDDLPGGRFKRDGFVFVPPEGESFTALRERNHVSQRTRAAAKAAGLAGVSFHTLRHTAASWLAQAGHSQVKIGKLLGHATVQTTNRYMHLSPAHLRDAADGLDAALCGSLGHQQDTEPSASAAPTESGVLTSPDSTTWAVSSGGRAPAF